MNLLTWNLFNWKDVVEILFFSSAIYFFSRWLIKDKKKNLLIPFYSYLFTLLLAYNYDFITVSSLLINFSPAALLLLIILHKETLQRNYILTKNIVPAQKITDGSDWIDILLKSYLMGFNQKKNIIVIIEQRDSLQELLKTSSFIKADITTGFLPIIIESAGYNPNQYIWINGSGILVAINAEIEMTLDQTWLSTVAHLTKLQQESLFLTQKSDAIIVRSNFETRLFDVITASKQYEHLNAQTASKILKKYCASSFIKQEGSPYANHSKTTYNKSSPS